MNQFSTTLQNDWLITDTQCFSYSQGQWNPGCYTICYWQGPPLKQTLLICCIFQLFPPSLRVLQVIQMCWLWLCYAFYPHLSLLSGLVVYCLFNSFFSLKNIIRTQIHFYSRSVSPLRLITLQSWATKTQCIMTHPHKSHLTNNLWKSQLVMPDDELRLARSDCKELCLPFAVMHLNSHCSSTSSAVMSCTSCKYPQTTG